MNSSERSELYWESLWGGRCVLDGDISWQLLNNEQNAKAERQIGTKFLIPHWWLAKALTSSRRTQPDQISFCRIVDPHPHSVDQKCTEPHALTQHWSACCHCYHWHENQRGLPPWMTVLRWFISYRLFPPLNRSIPRGGAEKIPRLKEYRPTWTIWLIDVNLFL
jgi:hypothetical protein